MKRSLNVVSTILKSFLSSLLGVDNTTLLIIFAVKHLLQSGY